MAMFTIAAIDAGFYDNTGGSVGDDNTYTGESQSLSFNPFFVFDLNGVSGTIASVTFNLQLESWWSPAASETVAFYDVSTDVPTLRAGTAGVAAYADLGSGTSYGSVVLQSSDLGLVYSFTLSAAAIADIQAHAGGLFVIGGTLATVEPGPAGNGTFSGLSNEGVRFSAAGWGGTSELVIQTTSPPIEGTPGDDVLDGTTGDDTINGYAGNDLINGLAGHDIINGGDDDDLIRPGSGDDDVDGGSGWDRVSYASVGGDNLATGVTVSLLLQGLSQNTGGGGWDTLVGIEHLTGTHFGDALTGDDNDNWLWGGLDPLAGVPGGNDTIIAGGGNDLVEVVAGDHTLDGGTGEDALSFFSIENNFSGGVTFSLDLQGAAQPTGHGSMNASGFESLSGSIYYEDWLLGNGGDNTLAGDLGNDVLVGGDGNDRLFGDGRITVDTHGTGSSGPITVYEDVSATFGLAGGDDTLHGGLGDDYLVGGGGIDSAVYALASGSITVSLTDGLFSFASGADGNDTLVGIENVHGSTFNDVILGNSAANQLDGYLGHDFLLGRGGDDVLNGHNGDDCLIGGVGDDRLSGGHGWDRASYALGATGGVTVDLNVVGIAQATGQGNDTLSGIEHLSGTIYDDVLTGDGGSNWLWGGSDASGVTGNDTISADGGDDLVEVGTGTHTLIGGTGIDTLSLRGNTTDITAAGVTFSLALQGAAQDSEQGMMNASGFEHLSGSIYDDSLTGDSGANWLMGERGNDTLVGGIGSDSLYGDGYMSIGTIPIGGGPITLYTDITEMLGEPGGNDTLIGGKGDDFLYGGRGDDVLTGSQGSDIFVIEASSGDDRVTDFSNMDKIRFDPASGVDEFSDLTIVQFGRDALISWGTGGDTLLLEGVRARSVSASDFVFGATSPAAAMTTVVEDMSSSSFTHPGMSGEQPGWLW